MTCLTVADDRSTVYTPTRPLLVTQRRSPTRVTMAVVVVVAQLERETAVYWTMNLKIATEMFIFVVLMSWCWTE